MEIRVDALQSEVVQAWVRQPHEPQPTQRIQPVKKPESSVLRKEDKEGKEERKREPLATSQYGVVKEAAESTQAYLEDLNIRLDFKIHEETGNLVVRVFNRETDELIREVPPEELLNLNEKLSELRGILFDQMA
jgi:flagellar protein FlaG